MPDRSNPSVVFLRKGVLKICSKFTGEYPCRSAISIELQSNFIEITLRHGYSAVKLLHIFRTPFPRNTSGWLLLARASFLTKLQASVLQFYQKWDSDTGVFLWLLRDFSEHFFLKNISGGCFCTVNEYLINYSFSLLFESVSVWFKC